jgi:hypothetical protein
MQRHLISWRPATVVVTALAASVTIAACGGSSSSGSNAASTANTGLKYAACVRAHGVPDYPDPHNGKVTVNTHNLSESATVVSKAEGTCQKYAPGLNLNSLPRLSSAQMARVKVGGLDYAKCMRTHGVPEMPDPIVKPGPGGHGIEYGYSAKALDAHPLPYKSPTYARANTTCSKVWSRYTPASLRHAG